MRWCRLWALAVLGSGLFVQGAVGQQDGPPAEEARRAAEQRRVVEAQQRYAEALQRRQEALRLYAELHAGAADEAVADEAHHQMKKVVGLQQHIHQMIEISAMLSRHLEHLERAENELLGEPLDTRSQLFASAEKFGQALKNHIGALERALERQAGSGDAPRIARRVRAIEQQDAERIRIAEVMELQKQAELAAADVASRVAAEERKRQEAMMKLVQQENQRIAEIKRRSAHSDQPSSESEDRLRKVEARLERIEAMLEKLAKQLGG